MGAHLSHSCTDQRILWPFTSDGGEPDILLPLGSLYVLISWFSSKLAAMCGDKQLNAL